MNEIIVAQSRFRRELNKLMRMVKQQPIVVIITRCGERKAVFMDFDAYNAIKAKVEQFQQVDQKV